MNKNERLFELIGDIDSEYITQNMPELKSGRIKRRLFAAGLYAAAAAALVVVSVYASDYTSNPYEDSFYNIADYMDNTVSKPDKINSDMAVGGMGFEGYCAYDVSEVLENNPWSEDWELTELPVFMAYGNESYDKCLKELCNTDTEKLKEKVYEIAHNLGKEVTEVYQENFENDSFSVIGKADDTEITVNNSGEITIDFLDGEKLPEKYRLKKDADISEAEETVDYISKKYIDILQMAEPAPSVFKDYTYSGEPLTRFSCYDKSSDPLTAIINYNFQTTHFSYYGLDENGDDISFEETGYLGSIISGTLLGCKMPVGMYPIINYDTAKDMLMKGSYVTTVWVEHFLPDGFTESDVTFVGVEYRQNSDHTYYLPYYKFLILLHDDYTYENVLAEGLKEYGAFYVPAVRSEYLTGVETETAFNYY